MNTERINPFTDDEFAWLWPKYRACGFPVASFPKRFARNEFSQLSEKGKNTGAGLAYQYRRQILGKQAGKYTWDEFVMIVKRHAAKPQP